MPEPPRRNPAGLPLAAPVEREPTLVHGFPRAPGTGLPLPPRPKARPTLRDLEAVTAIQKRGGADLDATAESPPAPRQDARSQAIDTPIGPQDPKRGRLPERQPPRSMSPAPWDPRASSPELRREVERMGDELRPAPTSTATPTPSGTDVDLRVGDVRVRVGSSVARRVLPWLAPVLLSVAGAGLGYVKGYLEGLAAAGRRVAAVEEAVKLNGEDDARRDVRIQAIGASLAAEAQSNRAERATRDQKLESIEERLPKIEGLRPMK